MPSSFFDRLWQAASTKHSTPTRRKISRAGRYLAFESLETRQMMSVTALTAFSVSANTGEKPESKVFEYQNQWYSVMPDKTGTWLWHLNGAQWEHQLQLSSNTISHSDIKVDGGLAHVLLFEGTNSQLATIQYNDTTDKYEAWALRPQPVNVTLSSGVETATLDVDSTGRLWIASDVSSTVEVRYADLNTQYTNWSAPITVASGITSDDISSVIAMPNHTIGVFWSNQNTQRFGFRTHVDGAAPTVWSADEVPAGQSALSKGHGMADDHMHLTVASDGTIYAAVKTSYDSSGYTKMALLVRRPSGVWDNIYDVDGNGTRPVVLINEAARKLIIAYTSSEGGGDIVYKESSMDNIAFGPRQTLISGSVNNVATTKQTFTDEVVLIAEGGGKAKGAMFRFDTPAPNAPPVVNAGPDRTVTLGASASLDGTVTDDGKPTPVAVTTGWSVVSGPGTVTFGNTAAVDTTASFSVTGTYVLRLTANDGQLSASDTMTVTVQDIAPLPPPPANLAPVVNAGVDQSIVLGTSFNLLGTASDDGKPASPGTLTLTWTRVSGPGTATFGNAASATSSVQFSAVGTYVLRLTANDGQLQSFDDITITVLAPPVPTPAPKKKPSTGKGGPR